MAKYIVVVKQLDSGKFILKFPDFEGITTVAETEDTIQKIATNVLQGKINELQINEIEIEEPLSIVEVTKTLNHEEGEFTTIVEINEKKKLWNKDAVKINTENIAEASTKAKENVEKILKSNIKEGQENILGMIGGIIFALSIFLPILSVDIPFLGKFRLGFFPNEMIQELSRGEAELRTHLFMIRFIILLMTFAGIFTAYSYFRKNKFYIKSSLPMILGLFIIFLIYIEAIIFNFPADIRGAIGISFAFLGYFIGILLVLASFLLMHKQKGGR